MSRNDSAQRGERMLSALELRRAGKTYREIGAILRCEPSTALRDVRAALLEARVEVTQDVKDLELARLDRMLERLTSIIEREGFKLDASVLEIAKASESPGGYLESLADAGVNLDETAIRAIVAATKLMERRAKLLGLDAPTKTQDVPPDEVAKMSDEEKLAAHRKAAEELEQRIAGKDGMH
jgi:hypothetical protein